MSRFRQYSIVDLYNSTKTVFEKTIDEIKTTFDDIANKTNSIINDIKNQFTK